MILRNTRGSVLKVYAFLSPPVLMHGGLLCVTLCLLLDQKSLDKHISGSITPRVMKFGMGMYLDDIWVDL